MLLHLFIYIFIPCSSIQFDDSVHFGNPTRFDAVNQFDDSRSTPRRASPPAARPKKLCVARLRDIWRSGADYSIESSN